ncbi:pyridoxamine 5'-phosphate oxidase family protein [Nocardia miyunensis]|uniref:pyridoxamine 5'-phosphate oxidase family protein n=1 Tax=Nocardia miyunensis TaxID=282684 RepID=UPI000A567823|nr:pyridoxamine 5'-phosphate oxidase family protein [Nocardia miyunensis]
MWIDPSPSGADPSPTDVEPEPTRGGLSSLGAAVDLDRVEAMQLLAHAPCGRVVFTRDALPAIRPVRHIVRDDRIFVLVRLHSRPSEAIGERDRVVVAYEVDNLDPGGQTGWAVVVTGPAYPITDPDLIARYDPILRTWLDGTDDVVVAIEPTIVTGFARAGPH